MKHRRNNESPVIISLKESPVSVFSPVPCIITPTHHQSAFCRLFPPRCSCTLAFCVLPSVPSFIAHTLHHYVSARPFCLSSLMHGTILRFPALLPFIARTLHHSASARSWSSFSAPQHCDFGLKGRLRSFTNQRKKTCEDVMLIGGGKVALMSVGGSKEVKRRDTWQWRWPRIFNLLDHLKATQEIRILR